MSMLLQSGFVGHNKTQEEILSNWGRTGLLEGLKSNNRKLIANALERGAQYLLTLNLDSNDERITYYFPIIRRVMSLITKNSLKEKWPSYYSKLTIKERNKIKKIILEKLDVRSIWDWLYNHFNNYMSMLANTSGNVQLDLEAETCAELSEVFALSIIRRFSKIDVYTTKSGKTLLFEK